jgi:hypothetical protein
MIAHWYNDGGTWRQTNALWYNDAGTWREMAEVWYNDGGTWRRVHRRELRRPTAYSVSDGSFDIESNTNYAYDADNSTHRLTYGFLENTGDNSTFPIQDHSGTAQFDTWQTTSNTYNTLSLYISADVNIYQNNATSSRISISYTLDGGATPYSTIWTSGSGSTLTTQTPFQLSKSLSPSQDLSLLGVRVLVIGRAAFSGTNGVANAAIFDIFTVGTY